MMTTPDQSDTIVSRNQVLQPMTGVGAVQLYRITTLDSSPQYRVGLTSSASFEYSHSATGPWITIPASAFMTVGIHQETTDLYINITGTLTLLTD